MLSAAGALCASPVTDARATSKLLRSTFASMTATQGSESLSSPLCRRRASVSEPSYRVPNWKDCPTAWTLASSSACPSTTSLVVVVEPSMLMSSTRVSSVTQSSPPMATARSMVLACLTIGYCLVFQVLVTDTFELRQGCAGVAARLVVCAFDLFVTRYLSRHGLKFQRTRRPRRWLRRNPSSCGRGTRAWC